MSNGTGNTGTQDVTYNLVSILYHALQGAETYDQYIQDAQGVTSNLRSSSGMSSRRISSGRIGQSASSISACTTSRVRAADASSHEKRLPGLSRQAFSCAPSYGFSQ